MTMSRITARLIVLALIVPTMGFAQKKSFTPEEMVQLKAVIESAVAQALNDQSVGDGNPHTQPHASVIRSSQAPNLSEEQRIELGLMIDAAVHNILSGQTTPTSGVTPTPSSTAAVGGDPRDPLLPMTDLTKERLTKIVREQGFDVDAASRALETDVGTVQSALKLTDTGLNTAASTPGASSMQILVGTENARASLKLDQSSQIGDTVGTTHFWSRSLVFSAPINKDSTNGTELIGLGGLTNGFEVAYNATRMRTEGLGRPKKGEPSLLFSMPTHCKELGIPISECDYSTLLRVAKAKSSGHDALASKAKAIANDYALPGRVFFQGFRLKAGHDEMSFYDPASLSKDSEDKIPWSTGVFVGRLSGSAYYSAGIDLLHGYKASKAGTACPAPDPISGISRCITGPLGEPSTERRHLLNVEARWLWGERAIGVTIMRDVRNDHWGLEIPIYLFPNDKGLLSGGLRLSWTDIDRFSAGVFVGAPFKLFE